MTASELACVVQEMRVAQREYFRTRSASALEHSKRLERKVDKCCERVLDSQRRLFPDEEM